MALLQAKSASPKRVILRAHLDLFPVHNEIVNAWFFRNGYCQKDQTYLWTEGGHFMRIGLHIRDRFHIIIDIDKDGVENPDMKNMPYEIWKVIPNPDKIE
jgi:hypothetical protein